MSVGVSACSFSLANNVDKHPQILSSGSTPCTPKVTNNLVFKSGHMTQTCPIPLVQSECCPGIRAHTGEQRSCLLAQSGVATLQLPVVMFSSRLKGRKNKADSAVAVTTTGREKPKSALGPVQFRASLLVTLYLFPVNPIARFLEFVVSVIYHLKRPAASLLE